MSTELTIPDDILEAAGLTERDCLIELAVHLYAERRITLGQALRLSYQAEKQVTETVLTVVKTAGLKNQLSKVLRKLGYRVIETSECV